MNLRGAFYTPYSLSRGAPSASWVLPQVDGKIQLAERVGFEPTDAFTSPVFKTGAFDHSAISPCAKASLVPNANIILPCIVGFVNKKPQKKFEKNSK